MILNQQIQRIVNEAAKELGIDKHAATAIYRSYWMFIKEKISELPDLKHISEEEFNKLRVSFNLPELGKFITDYKNITKINKSIDIINERVENKKRKTIT